MPKKCHYLVEKKTPGNIVLLFASLENVRLVNHPRREWAPSDKSLGSNIDILSLVVLLILNNQKVTYNMGPIENSGNKISFRCQTIIIFAWYIKCYSKVKETSPPLYNITLGR